MWKKLIATLPSSTKLLNKKLDERAVRDEPVNLDEPWRQRKFFATAWTTIKSWIQ